MSREMLYHGDIDLDKNEELKIPIAQEVEATVWLLYLNWTQPSNSV